MKKIIFILTLFSALTATLPLFADQECASGERFDAFRGQCVAREGAYDTIQVSSSTSSGGGIGGGI